MKQLSGPTSNRGPNRHLVTALLFALLAKPQWISTTTAAPGVPKLWDEEALVSMTLPAAIPGTRILYVSAQYYYSIPEAPAWKSYPVYAPGREPQGYLEWLKTREPELVFDLSAMREEKDWTKAGEVIFQTPYESVPLAKSPVRDPDWFNKLNPPLTKDWAITAFRYIIRRRGEIEVGGGSCASCHSRVLSDGSVIMGAQGNFPMDAAYAFKLRKVGDIFRRLTDPEDRKLDSGLIFPEIAKDDLSGGLYAKSVEEVAAAHEAMIPGIAARPGFSILDMPKIADLIGVKNRKFLDLTARLEHRSIGDLMRYGVMCAGGNYFFTSLSALPADAAPKPSESWRPPDEEYYALARYIYSLQPPPNPNLPKTMLEKTMLQRGREVFEREDCASCHSPPLYTNNRLTPAGKFQVPELDRTRYTTNIMNRRVGTDERSATVSYRGRGYYKVPSLMGLWYRGPFEHNGSVATLDDWFDKRRLSNDYVPTGFKGYHIKTRAVKGHEFGLDLSPKEKEELIRFLKSL